MTRPVTLQLPLAFVLLAAGGAVYLLLRPQKLLLFRVADGLGLTSQVNRWRSSVSGVSVPDWTVYCLPDALWTTAYLLVIDCALRDATRQQRLQAAAVIPALGLASELLQGAGLLPGTFDALDLVAYALPYLIYNIILRTKNDNDL